MSILSSIPPLSSRSHRGEVTVEITDEAGSMTINVPSGVGVTFGRRSFHEYSADADQSHTFHLALDWDPPLGGTGVGLWVRPYVPPKPPPRKTYLQKVGLTRPQ